MHLLSRKVLFLASIAVLVSAGTSFVQGDLVSTMPRGQPSSSSSLSTNPNPQNKEASTTTDTTTSTNSMESTKVTRQTWNPLRLAVLKLGMTEFPGTSRFNYGKFDGEFTCAYCGNVLFDSTAKYDSKSGWPSFWRSAESTSMDYRMELDGRLEARCQKCKSHLGHVFLDGPRPSSIDAAVLENSPSSDPRGRTNTYLPRFCINGAALNFQAREENE